MRTIPGNGLRLIVSDHGGLIGLVEDTALSDEHASYASPDNARPERNAARLVCDALTEKDAA